MAKINFSTRVGRGPKYVLGARGEYENMPFFGVRNIRTNPLPVKLVATFCLPVSSWHLSIKINGKY